MPNVIQFLEALGAKPAPSAAEYAAIVAGLGFGDAQREALLDGDHAALSELLDARTKMMFMVSSPSPDEPDAIPDDDKDGDGVPDNEEQLRE